MHAGSLATSKQLQSVHALLADGDWHTTQDILDGSMVAAVSPAISALRQNGCVIDCRYKTTTATGAKVYEYQMQVPRGQASLFGDQPLPEETAHE